MNKQAKAGQKQICEDIAQALERYAEQARAGVWTGMTQDLERVSKGVHVVTIELFGPERGVL